MVYIGESCMKRELEYVQGPTKADVENADIPQSEKSLKRKLRSVALWNKA